MADKRISELTATPSALTGTEVLPLVQGATTNKETLRNVVKLGYQDIQTASGATKTLALTDRGAWIRFTNATACAVTVPTNASVAFAIGESINGIQASTGKVTVAGDTGVTINVPSEFKNNTRAQGAPICLIKVATDAWDLMGDLEAV